ncbi:MAG: phosphonate C-P lyase system protein PhnH [Dehalococcoidia bacterium]|uniref:phosphonate C-P lyase system protein PhnH n=1 Tax=Candidatus Amarobacter glycogenicus TaxID=3140699 RepID=UPI0031362777|nr:phosphonate C-P lyase system protein PhnH [Dehalococcoidia bacterium]
MPEKEYEHAEPEKNASRLLAIADEPALVALADQILAAHSVTVLRPPVSGACMMRAIETAEGSVFNLGEVSITEAEVELEGERGYCMVMGCAPQKALAGAVLDAAAEANLVFETSSGSSGTRSKPNNAGAQPSGKPSPPTGCSSTRSRMSAQAVIFTPQARQAQSDFREALECLARPGRIGLSAQQRSRWRPPGMPTDCCLPWRTRRCPSLCPRRPGVGPFRILGTGSRLVEMAQADYVFFIEDPGAVFTLLRRGEPELPESGATAIVSVGSLAQGEPYLLAGPGIAGVASLRVSGLSTASFLARDAACGSYPLGIDLFLVDAEGRLMGLPRTTRITPEAS